MLIGVLIVLGYLVMSVINVYFAAFTIDSRIDGIEFDGFTCLTGVCWPVLIPFFIMMWLMRLIAYPFRKEWW